MTQSVPPLWRRLLPAALLLAAAVAAFFLLAGVLSGKAQGEALKLAQESLRRSAVECYAIEGAYPADVAYLADHYGVTIDPNRFAVHYEFIAANLMPQITVLPVKAEARP